MIFWQQSRSGRGILRRKYNRLRSEIGMLAEREQSLTNQLGFAKHERESREKELDSLVSEYPDITTIPN